MISPYQQRKRAYTNILMFVGLMAMAMVAWLDHQDRLPERRPGARTEAVEVTSVAFTSANGVATEVQLDHHRWQLLQPINTPARESRVARLLELLSLDFSKGYDADTINMAAAGLGESARTLQLGDSSYRFGGVEPISAKRYVQLEQRVLLLEDRHLPLMDGGINAFAERLLPLQQVTSAILDTTPLNHEQLLAWQSTQALGVRSASTPATAHLTIAFKGSEPNAWSAWPDKGLWVLQPKGAEMEYLINSAQAATLGLTQP